MACLSTEYLGMKLKNPLILSSSGLTSSIDNLIKAEEAGIAAVVLKSLFEEDLLLDVKNMEQNFNDMLHPEAYEYLHETGMLHSIDVHYELLKKAKQTLSIPVIASLNCISSEKWIDYAQTIEQLGADALELNIGLMAYNFRESPQIMEDHYLSIFKEVKSKLSIPVSVKIGQNFTSIPNMTYRLQNAGADGVVLFNRFFSPDIDIDSMKMKAGNRFSTEAEFPQILRWTAIVSSNLKDFNISASTGIHSWENTVKILMAGASSVQLCSILYKKGISYVSEIINGIEKWMESKEFEDISDIRGLMVSDTSVKEDYYQRLQYLKAVKKEE